MVSSPGSPPRASEENNSRQRNATSGQLDVGHVILGLNAAGGSGALPRLTDSNGGRQNTSCSVSHDVLLHGRPEALEAQPPAGLTTRPVLPCSLLQGVNRLHGLVEKERKTVAFSLNQLVGRLSNTGAEPPKKASTSGLEDRPTRMTAGLRLRGERAQGMGTERLLQR